MNESKRPSKQMFWILCAVGFVLLLWIFVWQRVGKELDHAGVNAYYSRFTHDGAIYAAFDPDFIAETYGLTLTGTDADRGTSLGKAQFSVDGVTVDCPLYRVKALEEQSLADGVVLVERDGRYDTYELVGFTALSESPSITAVCQAYGIGSGADLQSVTVYDADGTVMEQITDAAELTAFYEKFAALGEDMGAAGQSRAYYDAYVEKYGESDAITLQDGVIETADDATYEQAMAFWGAGMCTVTIRTTRGLRLGDMVYAPVPGVFQAYGYYGITEPFFE